MPFPLERTVLIQNSTFYKITFTWIVPHVGPTFVSVVHSLLNVVAVMIVVVHHPSPEHLTGAAPQMLFLSGLQASSHFVSRCYFPHYTANKD